jgi:NADPH:quinone reductase-like Zn-dependent oxidoreductase
MQAMALFNQAPIESSPLRLVTVTDPVPGHGEVRVRVRSCAIAAPTST